MASSAATDSYAYDADGRETQSSQDVAGTSGAEVLTYGYYDDGLRKALSVAGPAGTQTNLETYTYRTDGLRAGEQFTNAGTSANFAWTFSAAGREQTAVDPWFTRTKTFDPYGQVATDTIPAGEYSNFQYDLAGNVTQFTGYAGTATYYQNTTITATQIPITYDADGQLVRVSYSNINNNMVPKPQVSPGPVQDVTGGHCDAFCDGALNNGYNALGGCPSLSVNQGCAQTTLDADGRENNYTAIWEYDDPVNCGNPSGCPVTKSTQTTYTHDAQNHLTACTFGGAAPTYAEGDVGQPACTGSVSISYAPDGRMAMITGGGGTRGPTPAYWDGDQLLLFSTEIYLGTFAVYNSAYSPTISVLDRDFSGSFVSEHNGTGNAGWAAPMPSQAQAAQGVIAATTGFAGTGIFIPNPKGDGYSVGGFTIQGARAYNPQVGTWTAPDAFQGDVGDPRTMSPYMWDNNNPIAYSDPSGYMPWFEAAYMQRVDGEDPSLNDSDPCNGIAVCGPPLGQTNPLLAQRIQNDKVLDDDFAQIMTALVPVGGEGEAVAGAIGASIGSDGIHIFWSGGAQAKEAAEFLARTFGGKTITMTNYGHTLEVITNALAARVGTESAGKIMAPFWRAASALFAGTAGKGYAVLKPAMMRPNPVWTNTEERVLRYFSIPFDVFKLP